MDDKNTEGYSQDYSEISEDNPQNTELNDFNYDNGNAEESSCAFPDDDPTAEIKKDKKVGGYFKKVFICTGITCAALILCLFFGTALGAVLGAVSGAVSKGGEAAQAEDTDVSPSVDTKSESYMELSSKTVNVIKNTKPSVVCIASTSLQTGFFDIQYEASSSGSGVIFHKTKNNIYIVTNNHVIDSATQIKVSFDGDSFIDAQVVGKESNKDLAVISVSVPALEESGFDTDNIKVASFSNSDIVAAGSQVIAIGNALGEGITATSGVVSEVNKEIDVDGKTLNVLQTDAAINPGNSGGALVNSNGDVIGINTAKISTESVEGIGYSIVSNDVKDTVEKIMRNEKSPFMGVYVSDIPDEFAQHYSLDKVGAWVTKIIPDTSAANSDIREGDIITGIDDKPVFNKDMLSEVINEYKVGDSVEVKLIRNGKNATVKMKLMAEPE